MALRMLCLAAACSLLAARAKPTCCWSKWGNKDTCGDYNGTGAQCNTDHTMKCNSDSDCPDAPVPTPPPTPPSPPTPPPAPPTPPSPQPTEIIGYWSETWSKTAAPSNANMGVAFSGWNDPVKAKNESEPIFDALVGDKWIDAGGGNKNGRWSADWLTKWEIAIKNGDLKKWAGIVFDVEECSESGLTKTFASVLAAAKAAGMRTLVTVSHSAPYACNDPQELMQGFFENSDIDYLSPQLYTNGNEPNPSFVAGNQVKWSDWTGAKGRFVPSIGCNAVKNGGYKQVQDYFAKYNITASGYVVWPSQGCAVVAPKVTII